MPKNEDGEFELILANRQLLSVFFIVVVLLGVFFTMGYIVGRNSGPAQVDVAATHKADVKPVTMDTPAPQETPAAPEFEECIDTAKRDSIRRAWADSKGDYRQAALILGIHPNSLLRLAVRDDITP